jgi:hypothetical protein
MALRQVAGTWAAFRGFTDEAIRMETYQRYDVPGDEARQRAFREGLSLPPRPTKSATLRLIEDAVASGKRMSRVRVVEKPLSQYVRYEIEAAYPENLAAGEEIWIADRDADPALEALREDFVLFDPDTAHASVIWYRYTPAGKLISWEPGTPEDVEACCTAVALARRFAVPVTEFVPTSHGRSF